MTLLKKNWNLNKLNLIPIDTPWCKEANSGWVQTFEKKNQEQFKNIPRTLYIKSRTEKYEYFQY